jgi:hypothetical protein
MNINELGKILNSVYDHSIENEHAWEVFNNFLELFMLEELQTTDYLCSLIELNKIERLKFRGDLAELGYELTPNELNQYILLLIIALGEYLEGKGKENELPRSGD